MSGVSRTCSVKYSSASRARPRFRRDGKDETPKKAPFRASCALHVELMSSDFFFHSLQRHLQQTHGLALSLLSLSVRLSSLSLPHARREDVGGAMPSPFSVHAYISSPVDGRQPETLRGRELHLRVFGGDVKA